jgi:hypothetical protein
MDKFKTHILLSSTVILDIVHCLGYLLKACFGNWIWTELVSVGFEVLMAVSTKMAVFWVVVPYCLVEVYQRFRGPCCLHHQGNEFVRAIEAVKLKQLKQ